MPFDRDVVQDFKSLGSGLDDLTFLQTLRANVFVKTQIIMD